MAKEGVTGRENILKHYVAICEAVEGDVSAEVIATDIDGMIRGRRGACCFASADCCKNSHD